MYRHVSDVPRHSRLLLNSRSWICTALKIHLSTNLQIQLRHLSYFISVPFKTVNNIFFYTLASHVVNWTVKARPSSGKRERTSRKTSATAEDVSPMYEVIQCQLR